MDRRPSAIRLQHRYGTRGGPIPTLSQFAAARNGETREANAEKRDRSWFRGGCREEGTDFATWEDCAVNVNVSVSCQHASDKCRLSTSHRVPLSSYKGWVVT